MELHNPQAYGFMSSAVQLDRTNRRRCVRHKVHAPAYASFSAASKGFVLELQEVLDISENGVAIQCPSQLEPNSTVTLCLDLSGDTGQLHTTALVAWSDPAGRTGLSLRHLPDSALRQLREWLFFNAIVATANAGSVASVAARLWVEGPRPNYSDTLSAVSAVQREAEALGADLVAALQLISSRAQILLRSSGAAIALATAEADTLICGASCGPSAPPIGAKLRAGSGFSGQCVRSGRILRCDDTETDARVDRESCRDLGIRSMMAAPVRMGERVRGLVEVFSSQPGNFNDHDSVVLQRLAETVLAAVNRVAHVDDGAHSPALAPQPIPFRPSPGSVLFASAVASDGKESKAEGSGSEESPAETHSSGIRLPRSLLVLLIFAAAAICLALGWVFAPWIQQQVHARTRHSEQTVFASAPAPKPATTTPPALTVETANLEQLQQLAAQGNAAAENALGLRYATGDGVQLDEKEAARWFTNAAEHGNVAAQSKLGQLYWDGRGVPASINQAYFWTILARASGQEASKTLAPMMASRLSQAQRTTIEQQADAWYREHEVPTKPSPAR